MVSESTIISMTRISEENLEWIALICKKNGNKDKQEEAEIALERLKKIKRGGSAKKNKKFIDVKTE